MPNDLLLVGDGPEVVELAERFRSLGRSVQVVHWDAPRMCADASDSRLSQAAAAARDAAHILEFVEGSLEGKREVQTAMECPAAGVILSSSYRVGPTEVASWRARDARVVGLSGIAPFGERKCVELQRGLCTSTSAWEAAAALCVAGGWQVEALGDHPGGAQARIVCCLVNEAVSLLSEAGASAADIDVAMRLGTNYPHGPLAWGEQLGLDRVLAVMEGLEREYCEDRYRAHPMLRKLVLAGQTGAGAFGARE